MYQNTCVGFKLGYVDAKSDAIAFCVKTFPSKLRLYLVEVVVKLPEEREKTPE